MGTPDFAVPALSYLYEQGHEILCAVSQPDKPAGRHKELLPTPVKKRAQELGIKVLQPLKATDPAFIEEIKAMEPDVCVVCAYGKILRKVFLDIPEYGVINIHASLLPKYRGSAPIQWSIINGDKKTGITIMQLDEGMDTGDMLMQKEIEISPEETGGSLFEKLKDMGGPMCHEVLMQIEAGTAKPVKQDDSLAVKAPMLTKEMGLLDFTKTAEELSNLVRGLYPWPGAYVFINGKMLKIHRSEASAEITDKEPGTVYAYEDEIKAACAGGTVLLLKEVQLEGKKAMSAAEFLRGSRKVFE